MDAAGGDGIFNGVEEDDPLALALVQPELADDEDEEAAGAGGSRPAATERLQMQRIRDLDMEQLEVEEDGSDDDNDLRSLFLFFPRPYPLRCRLQIVQFIQSSFYGTFLRQVRALLSASTYFKPSQCTFLGLLPKFVHTSYSLFDSSNTATHDLRFLWLCFHFHSLMHLLSPVLPTGNVFGEVKKEVPGFFF